jgi:hypothetical protein
VLRGKINTLSLLSLWCLRSEGKGMENGEGDHFTVYCHPSPISLFEIFEFCWEKCKAKQHQCRLSDSVWRCIDSFGRCGDSARECGGSIGRGGGPCGWHIVA